LKRKLMEILACPIDKHHPLDLHVFDEKSEVVEGIITCSECNRFYPIIDEIPHMLPDNLRSKDEDLKFLKKWIEKLPEKVKTQGKPFNLESN
jgi:uncharacterized protein YbaR (Trm112 family)